MRISKFFIYIFISIFLGGCSAEKNHVSIFLMDPTDSQIVIERSYEEVKNKTIKYEDVFSIDLDSYYVYFYSKTCSHCASLKSFMISTALDRDDIYFVESCSEINFKDDVSWTIGASSLESLYLIGYPSLLKIENKRVVLNIAGKSLIKEAFLN